MKLSKGNIEIEVTGRSIKLGEVSLSPSEVSLATDLLRIARSMTALPVLKPISNNIFEVRFNSNKTLDFVRKGDTTTVEYIKPEIAFDDLDDLVQGLNDAVNSHIDMSKLGGDVRVSRSIEYLPDDPGFGT